MGYDASETRKTYTFYAGSYIFNSTMTLKKLTFLTYLSAMHAFAPVSFSQEEENTDQEIGELPAFEATAQQNPVDLGMPTVSVKLNEEDFEKINFINPEDALKYSPNINVRKRFIGDQNGVLSIRETVSSRMPEPWFLPMVLI